MFSVAGIFTVIFTVSSPPSFSHFCLILNQTNQVQALRFPSFTSLLSDDSFLVVCTFFTSCFLGWFGLCKAAQGHPSLLTCPTCFLVQLWESDWVHMSPSLSRSSAGNSVNRRGLVSPADLNDLALLQIVLVTLISKCPWASASLYELWVVNIESKT